MDSFTLHLHVIGTFSGTHIAICSVLGSNVTTSLVCVCVYRITKAADGTRPLDIVIDAMLAYNRHLSTIRTVFYFTLYSTLLRTSMIHIAYKRKMWRLSNHIVRPYRMRFVMHSSLFCAIRSPIQSNHFYRTTSVAGTLDYKEEVIP